MEASPSPTHESAHDVLNIFARNAKGNQPQPQLNTQSHPFFDRCLLYLSGEIGDLTPIAKELSALGENNRPGTSMPNSRMLLLS